MDSHSIRELDHDLILGLQTYTTGLMIVGLFSNCLLLITLRYKQSRFDRPPLIHHIVGSKHKTDRRLSTKPCSDPDFLLTCLTSADIANLLTLVLRYNIFLVTDYDIRIVNSVVCSCHTFISMIASNWSLAVLCVMSTHRSISLCWPLKSKAWLTRRRLRLALIVASLVILVKHLPVLFLFRLIQDDKRVLAVNRTNIDGVVLPGPKSRIECDILLTSPVYTRLSMIYYSFEFASHGIIGHAWLVVVNLVLCVKLVNRRPVGRIYPLPANQSSQFRSSLVVVALSWIQLATSIPFFLLIEFSQLVGWHPIPFNRKLKVFYACVLTIYTNNVVNYIILLLFSATCRRITRCMLEEWMCCCCSFAKHRDKDRNSSQLTST